MTGESVPDRLQIGLLSMLLALAALPLLFYMKAPVAGYIALLLLARVAVLWRPALTPGRWPLVALALLGVGVVLAAYRELAGQDAGTALLLTMMVLKTLEIRGMRDLRVSLLLFGFLLVVAFLFNQSPLFAIYLGVLLLGSFALLADLSAVRPASITAATANASRYGARIFADRQAWFKRLRTAGRRALVLSAQAVPLAALLFVLFPRLDSPLWSLGLERERAKTGVSDSLELGNFSELVRSGAVAFHAYFDQPLPVEPSQLYWRGPVLWQTDGRGWEPGDDALMDELPADIEPLGERLDYAIVMEPTEQRWIFALDLPLAAPADARLTRDARLVAKERLQELKRFELRSALKYRSLALTPPERELALEVPERMITPRMRLLVGEWREQGGGARAIVARALAHINQEAFRYTLRPPPLGANPVDDFLFETRAGYCEHYASSFALLMRLADIPARLVVGYLGAERNPLGGHYLVRQSDAHAWAEVWLEDSGWTRVDPTAAVAPERVDNDAELADLGGAAPLRFRVTRDSALGRLAHSLRLLVDAGNAAWNNWVVNFSSTRQQRLLEALGLEHLGTYGLVLGLASGGAALMLLLHALLARRRWPADPVERSYARLCQRLARVGLAREPGEGPRDYLRRVAKARPDLAQALYAWLAFYLPLRFGGAKNGQAQQALIQRERRMIIRRKV
ncbi:Protein-glutamine gamma-glutamyltransferase [Thiorhodovibrio winogradskyi]|uniref:Protein-glutamine gamma-glutamyltransferase n=2 Tax=Thiorhodovibrio winogradskyi TaxID=77007 RepID=A0ABZ0SFQ1_9GAMM